MSYLTLEDQNGTTYNFPETFWINGGNISANNNVVNKSFANGGRQIADGYLKSKIVTVSGILQGDTLAQFETKKRALSLAIFKGGKLIRSGDSVDRYINVIFDDVNEGDPSGEEDTQLQSFTISFIAEFPFWEDYTEIDDSNIVAGNDTLTIDLTGSDNIVFSIITISANRSVDVPGVKMINRSDGATSFIYNDPLFTSGDIVVIDTKKGTVTRNGGSSIENFSGNFLRLQPVENEIEYEGAACTITFSYRKVYL